MTLQTLFSEKMKAMKADNKPLRNTLTLIIAQIKKSAIDKNCRDNITEDFVNAELLRYKKQVEETIAAIPKEDPRHMAAVQELAIVKEYAPVLINDPAEIMTIYDTECRGKANSKKDVMKFFSQNYRGKVDMKIVSQCMDKIF